MEFFLQFWDEIDDALGYLRHHPGILALCALGVLTLAATPLLFLLGVEDIVFWARELGGTKLPRFTDYPHGDWRIWYFLGLLVFYLGFTKLSEFVLDRLSIKLAHGQNLAGTA